ncbi:hypothetical protein [Nostoc sp. ChiVER01]|uniref:hypothetical protein n=1 Tax=Nostoc sp. ChiVER01 TaxID=3075382 RepID=UPI002AD335DC|nr:hypothetical protein [Nostoc sp. ChiVER01]MDZ8222796.1 hypothetical protein [Nostoc sp. ChiVER01]
MTSSISLGVVGGMAPITLGINPDTNTPSCNFSKSFEKTTSPASHRSRGSQFLPIIYDLSR